MPSNLPVRQNASELCVVRREVMQNKSLADPYPYKILDTQLRRPVAAKLAMRDCKNKKVDTHLSIAYALSSGLPTTQ